VSPTRREFLRAAALRRAGALLRPCSAFCPAETRSRSPTSIRCCSPVAGCSCSFVTDQASPAWAKSAPECPGCATLITTAFKSLLVGRNPLDIERCWEAVFLSDLQAGPRPACSPRRCPAWTSPCGTSSARSPAAESISYSRQAARPRAGLCEHRWGGTAVAGANGPAGRSCGQRGFTAVKIRQDYGPVPPDVDPARTSRGSTRSADDRSGGTGP